MGHIPWVTFGDGRQLIVIILGLSGRRRVTKLEVVNMISVSSPSSGENRIAETLTNWGSAGGGVAIILTL